MLAVVKTDVNLEVELTATTALILRPCSACEHSELQFIAFQTAWQVVCRRCQNWADLSWSNDKNIALKEAADNWNKQQIGMLR